MKKYEEVIPEYPTGFQDLRRVFDFAELVENERKFNKVMAEPGFWDNRESAMKIISENKQVQAWLDPIRELESKLDNVNIAIELLEGSSDTELLNESESSLNSIEKKLDRLEFIQML